MADDDYKYSTTVFYSLKVPLSTSDEAKNVADIYKNFGVGGSQFLPTSADSFVPAEFLVTAPINSVLAEVISKDTWAVSQQNNANLRHTFGSLTLIDVYTVLKVDYFNQFKLFAFLEKPAAVRYWFKN
jgi:hypothetical protein